MKPAEIQQESRSDKADRLIDAALDLWCDLGTGDISTRMLASAAVLPTSGIYYHFDNVEHLYLDAQARAMTAAEVWCDAQLALLDAVAPRLPAEALGAALANVIDSFCEGERRLAFAWRECQILAAREPRFRPACEAWNALWQRFWQAMCARFGLPDDADLIRYFFDGESFLHLMRWNRPADRAGLGEMAVGWVGWLTRGPWHAAPWRLELKRRAQRSTAVADDPSAIGRRIALAAARLLIDGGVAAVTHRAVAAAADMTLGTVSHNCRRTDDLLRLAYEELYRSMTGRSPFPASMEAPTTSGPAVGPSRAKLLALDELLIAVARGRADRDLALPLRYLRGTTSRLVLADLGEGNFDLAAAIYSSVMMGAGRALGHLTEDEARDTMAGLHDRILGDFSQSRTSGS